MPSKKEIGIEKNEKKKMIVNIFPRHSQHKDNRHQTTTPT
jgi:hypothetical protein